MTTEREGSERSGGRRFEVLLALLALLFLIFGIGRISSRFPSEPRWVVVNRTGGTARGVALIGPRGRFDVGQLEDGQNVLVRLDPRSADRYRLDCEVYAGGEFSGSELLRLWEIARSA